MEIDLEELACLVDLLKAAEFSEFRYEKGDLRLIVRRGALSEDSPGESPTRVATIATSTIPVAQSVAISRVQGEQPAVPNRPEVPVGAVQVTAPLLGTFYGRPKPGEAPFVKVGERVERDTVLCIVEVMKLMNSVCAGQSGVLAAVHAADGQLVEFGQVLFSIVPDPS